jgi:FdhE protein
MTRDEWLHTHPFLRPLALFLDQVDGALAGIDARTSRLPNWDDYAADHAAGIPLLRSVNAAVELEPAGTTALALIDRLAAGPTNDKLAADARVLGAELRRQPGTAQRLVDWLLGEADFVPSSPGLLRHLGWAAIARSLLPLVEAFARWRDEDRWLRGYCPACGSAPAMAQLVGVDPVRKRLLACGCCGSRWRYQRTACPFCDNDSQRIGIVGIQGESGLRIDYCEACKAYLKTYDGVGQEALLLGDWSSLHLDVIAHDRGLKRMTASLYDLESLL